MHILSHSTPQQKYHSSQANDTRLTRARARRASLSMSYSNEYGTWMQQERTLLVSSSIAPSIVTGQQTVSFSFALQNVDTEIPPPEIFVTAESGLVKRIGVCEDPIDEGCTSGGEPSRARAILVSYQFFSSACLRVCVYVCVPGRAIPPVELCWWIELSWCVVSTCVSLCVSVSLCPALSHK